MNADNERLLKNSFTIVDIDPPKNKMNRKSGNLFMGSCFAENLYAYFKNHYINSFFSPFGNIYNPLSLASSLERLSANKQIKEDELFEHRELWRHFDFDTQKCVTDKKNYLELVNNSIKAGSEYLKNADNLILTLGTSFVYRNIESGQVVNNCHKLPSKQFIRENASIEKMAEKLNSALIKLKTINKDLNMIITLSPVRHIRDSASENSLSKARLRCLIDELNSVDDIWYFPSYEIMMDQLRDYRWYGDDLIHPSDKAIAYIMEKFIETAADADFSNYLMDIKKMNLSLNHRILHSDTKEAVKFIDSRKRILLEMTEKYPSMNEIAFLWKSIDK